MNRKQKKTQRVSCLSVEQKRLKNYELFKGLSEKLTPPDVELKREEVVRGKLWHRSNFCSHSLLNSKPNAWMNGKQNWLCFAASTKKCRINN